MPSRGADLPGDTSWIHVLSPRAIDEIDRAGAAVSARGPSFPDSFAADFPLPRLHADLTPHADESEGRGFPLLRGLPAERYTGEEIEVVCHGIGLHLGTPVRRNLRGDLLGAVMNVGDPDAQSTRVYEKYCWSRRTCSSPATERCCTRPRLSRTTKTLRAIGSCPARETRLSVAVQGVTRP